MENRTGFRHRSRGHAYYAEEARRALGIPDHGVLTVVPLPIFHGVIGALVAVLAVVVRPQWTGGAVGLLLDLGLLGIAVVGLAYYDRLVCPAQARPGVEAALLPVCALLSLFVLVAASGPRLAVVAAVVLCAVVVGWAPHLAALSVAGRETAWIRLTREVAGIAAIIPLLVVVGADTLPAASSTLFVGLGTLLTVGDALRVGRHAPAWNVVFPAAAVAAAMVAVVAAVAATRMSPAGAAVVTLAVWYGLQGACLVYAERRLAPIPLAEHLLFAVAGVVALILRLGAA